MIDDESKDVEPGKMERWYTRIHVRDPLPAWPQPVAVQATRVPPGTRWYGASPMHGQPHSSLVYTMGGVGRLTCGGEEHELTAGSAFIVRYPDPDHSHSVPETTFEWQNLYIDWVGGEALIDQLIQKHGKLFRFQSSSSGVRRLREFQKHDGQLIEMSAADGAQLVLTCLSGAFHSLAPNKPGTPRERLVSRARQAIYAQVPTGLNVNELAQTLGVSSEHLSRVFRAETGQTPQQFISTERVNTACLLLTTTSMDCSEIASRLGYSTASSFGKAFKNAAGVPPGVYREGQGNPNLPGDTPSMSRPDKP